MSSTLDQIIKAEADRLAEKWGRSAFERKPEGHTFVFGLLDDVQVGMVRVDPDGTVTR